jgi:hypothetical protein
VGHALQHGPCGLHTRHRHQGEGHHRQWMEPIDGAESPLGTCRAILPNSAQLPAWLQHLGKLWISTTRRWRALAIPSARKVLGSGRSLSFRSFRANSPRGDGATHARVWRRADEGAFRSRPNSPWVSEEDFRESQARDPVSRVQCRSTVPRNWSGTSAAARSVRRPGLCRGEVGTAARSEPQRDRSRSEVCAAARSEPQ